MSISTGFRRLSAALLLLAAGAAFGAEANDAGDQPIAGVVQDATGKAVGGAEVWLVTTSMQGETEVFDHARSDADGKFRLTLPRRLRQRQMSYRPELGVIAYQPEAGLAVAGYGRYSVPAESGLVLQAKAPRQEKLRILAPDGRPVAGARLTATSVVCDAIRTDLAKATDWQLSADMRAELKQTPNGPVLSKIAITLPSELSRRLAAETDREGRATIPGLSLDDIAALRVETIDYGAQEAFLMIPAYGKRGPALPETIKLKRVGKLSGRVVADDDVGKHVSAIRVNSTPPSDRDAQPLFAIHGSADVTPDAEGRFAIPAIAAGTISFRVTPKEDSPLRARVPDAKLSLLKAGELTVAEIPLVRGVRTSGVVRERGSKRPIAGIGLLVAYGGGAEKPAPTDKQGRFTCLVAPGQVLASPSVPPKYSPLTREAFARLIVTIPDDATEFEFPPVELTLLAPIRGVVVAEDGGPAPGAKVRARWFALDQATGQESLKDVSLTTDEHGAFALDAVDPDKELIVEARSPAGFGRVRLKLKDLRDDEIKLPLRSEDLIALGGRAMDTAGKPIAGATIEIWTMQAIEDRASAKERVKFDGDAEIRTDGEGRFQTPRELDRGSLYQARLVLPGRESVEKPWHVSLAKRPAFDDLVVRRVTTLAGRVLDRQGRPVAEAAVFQSGDAPQRAQTATDAAGRFRLEGAMADPTFVFVSQRGFRFFGQMVDGDEELLELTITRTDEPVEQPGKTLPRRLSHDERATLARRVLAPCLKEGVTLNEGETLRVLEALALADPAAALERLEKLRPLHPFFAGAVRRAAAKALARHDVAEALSVVEGVEDPFVRAICYLDIVDALGDDQRARKLELLGEASVAARQIDQPAMKALQLGLTAERLLDLDQRDQATMLLREGEAIAQQLALDAFGGYARGAFAEELAQLDLPAALELMKGISDIGEFDRHHGNAAHELAAKDPAAAERLLGMLHPAKESRNAYEPREYWGVRVCFRMAPVDLPRARRLADSFVNPFLKAQAYGMMAQAIGGKQRDAALELVEQAFAVLEELVRKRERAAPDGAAADRAHYYIFNASSLAGSLLPNIESIDPELTPEYFWRAVSFRLPPSLDEQRQHVADNDSVSLALTLARYNRDVAAAIFKPVQGRRPATGRAQGAGLAAAVLRDPTAAVEALEAAPAEKPDCLLRAELAEWLVFEGDELWRKVQKTLGLWAIDEEDLF